MNATLPCRISLYGGRLPNFAEAELERLYGSVYSSLAHFRVKGEMAGIDTYVAYRGDEITALLLFRCHGNRLEVMNQRIAIGREEVEQFARYIFAQLPAINVISFNALYPLEGAFAYPSQRYNCGESIIACLPDTVTEFVASLGSATRKNLRRHRNRLEREFPSVHFSTSIGEAVEEQHVRAIIGFNRIRMAAKGKVSKNDEAWTQWLMGLVRQRGMVTVALIEGRVCGGAVTVRIGDTCVSHVNAHDPLYDDFRLGGLCCFQTICESISRGARRFDFLWGEYEYKTAMLGRHTYLYRYLLYRSSLHLARNAGLAVREAFAGNLRQLRVQLLRAATRANSEPGYWFGRCVIFLRDTKKALVLLRNK